MVAYIEDVILINLILNAIVIRIAVGIIKLPVIWWRIILAAVIGTIFAVIYPYVTVFVWVFKLLCALLMAAFFTKYNSLKKYLLGLLSFLGITFTMAGAYYGLLFAGIDLVGSFSTFSNVIMWILLFAVFFTIYFAMQISRKVKRSQNLASNARKVDFIIKNKPVVATALVDTGNALSDGFTGKPLAVISKDIAKNALNGTERTIMVKTICAETALPVIELHNFTVDGRCIGKVEAVVSAKSLNGYKVIIGEEFLKEAV